MNRLMRFLLIVIQTFLGFWCPADMAPAGLACMDRYEAPNIEGARPLVMQSALDGQSWCEDRGKRLCSEREWDTACSEATEPCNNDKVWLPWEYETMETASEVARLWQGTLSGASSTCRTPFGVFDLQGNVEEWVTAHKGRRRLYTLKGGWWAHKTSCTQANNAHWRYYKNYETGFRCCLLPL